MSYICTIKQGNLLDEENATFIANASNTSLELGSGVSMAFNRHCKGLQKVMRDKLSELNVFNHGDVTFTDSCSTTFKYALHCAVMNYTNRKQDSKPSLETIENILYNIEKIILSLTSENNYKLVLPLMGCGVGGLSKEDVIQIYKQFFNRKVIINCEVIIYGYSIEDYNLINKIFNNQDEVFNKLYRPAVNVLHPRFNKFLTLNEFLHIYDLSEIESVSSRCVGHISTTVYYSNSLKCYILKIFLLNNKIYVESRCIFPPSFNIMDREDGRVAMDIEEYILFNELGYSTGNLEIYKDKEEVDIDEYHKFHNILMTKTYHINKKDETKFANKSKNINLKKLLND